MACAYRLTEYWAKNYSASKVHCSQNYLSNVLFHDNSFIYWSIYYYIHYTIYTLLLMYVMLVLCCWFAKVRGQVVATFIMSCLPNPKAPAEAHSFQRTSGHQTLVKVLRAVQDSDLNFFVYVRRVSCQSINVLRRIGPNPLEANL